MGTFTKGDVVLFPFPYTDLTNRKLRPCLVLSNEMGKDIILCQITSKKIQKDNNTIELSQSETVDGSLFLDSYIRCNMLFTSSIKQIHKKICAVSNSKYDTILDKIMEIIKK
tara:strand:+ start:327 stop:662 length:336 start_codon:yes stop_codon:yes gene_type:complete